MSQFVLYLTVSLFAIFEPIYFEMTLGQYTLKWTSKSCVCVVTDSHGR